MGEKGLQEAMAVSSSSPLFDVSMPIAQVRESNDVGQCTIVQKQQQQFEPDSANCSTLPMSPRPLLQLKSRARRPGMFVSDDHDDSSS
jgi:hypothetical protein